MSKYRTCNRCGAHLDYGERCECTLSVPMYDAVTEIWLEHYHKLTGESGAPSYDKHGSLYWWIVKHEPDYQSHILQMCYQAGYGAGYKANRPSGTNTETAQKKNAVNSATIVAEPERNVKL